MSLRRLLALGLASLAAGATGVGTSSESELVGELERQPRPRIRRRIRSGFNAYLLGGGKPGDSASAWFFREDRARRKALEWVRQRKADGLKPARERTLPEILEPTNQWRRDGDRLLTVDEAQKRALHTAVRAWRGKPVRA